jgi:hypothetical protein
MGTMRGVTVALVVAAASAVCVACSATTVSTGAPAADPSVAVASAYSLDGGALEVTPVAPRATTVDAAQAERVLALQYVYVTSVDAPVLATVSWTAAGSSGRPGAVLKQGALAWVLGFQHANPTPSCPVVPGTASPSATVGSASSAVVVDASTGAAMVYEGAYPRCPGSWGTPFVSAAARYESLAWETSGTQADYTVLLPPCAELAGSTTVNGAMNIVAAEPLDGPCPGTAQRVSAPGTASPRIATHAPVGMLCAGHEPAVTLPLPEGCAPDRQAF